MKDTKGGGVAIFVHKTLNYSIVAKSRVCNIGEVEFLLLRIWDSVTKASTLFATVYRPPKGGSYEQFFEVLSQNKNRADNIIVAGDFNCHLETKCSDSIEFRSLAKSCKLDIVNTGASFHEHTDSWLDVLLVDDMSKVVECIKSSVPFIDFHDSFILNYNLVVPQIPDKFYTFRDFKLCNHDQMKTDIALTVSINSRKLDDLPPETVSNYFTTDLINILDRYAPLRTIEIKP